MPEKISSEFIIRRGFIKKDETPGEIKLPLYINYQTGTYTILTSNYNDEFEFRHTKNSIEGKAVAHCIVKAIEFAEKELGIGHNSFVKERESGDVSAGDTIDTGTTAWSRHATGSQPHPAGYFEVRNNRFEASDLVDKSTNKFSLTLVDSGPNKTQVARILKEELNLTLKEVVKILRNLPFTICNQVDETIANKLNAHLQTAKANTSMVTCTNSEIEKMLDKDYVKKINTTKIFNVELIHPGPAKLQLVKFLKELTGLRLKEAKSFADNVPSTIMTQLPFASAQNIKNQIELLGAEARIYEFQGPNLH